VPTITVTPESWDYENLDIRLHETANKEFVFKNEGPGEWRPGDGFVVALDIPEDSEEGFIFLVSLLSPCDVTPVAEHGTCRVAVEFYPDVPGDYEMAFAFNFSPEVEVSGEGEE
jgi:hypothetical protein